MPLELPVLDDRNYEQLLAEAKRRIPVHTPEWTNYNVESDPGITLVQLFAFLTDSLLYQANRIPERNRLKFLQLLGIPLQPAAAAEGLIAIRNDRGPVAALTLGAGVIVNSGSVNFLTRDDVTVLPLDVQVFYKKAIDPDSERYAELQEQHEAVIAALEAARESDPSLALDSTLTPAFYETAQMTLPTVGEPDPVLDVATDTLDDAIYLALLAPKQIAPDDVRDVIANRTLSIGVVPALTGEVDPLLPVGQTSGRAPLPNLVYEIPNVAAGADNARYQRLTLLQAPDVLDEIGIVQVLLPDAAALQTWEFSEPLAEGRGDFPPRLEDDSLRERLVTWLRIRIPQPEAGSESGETVSARLTWVGINATRIIQAVPVVNEQLGQGNGEPDQVAVLANTPVLPSSLVLELQQDDGAWRAWRLTDDLLAADVDDEVYTLDPEAGQIRFGTGLYGKRPAPGQRIRASYEYGGGRQGNVAVGEIKSSPDVRLQGGFKIENPIATSGGDEGETVAEGERNIPLYLRHRDRLVTESDFAAIVARTPGVDVGRVEILPLFYPPNPAQPEAGVVTVLAIPAFDKRQPLWPTPDRLFLRRICSHITPRRLVTTEIYVRGPEYVAVHLSVGVQVREGYYRDEVINAVRDRLRLYLSSLPPGGPDETGWPLNRRLLKKELEAVVARVAGVDYVDSMYMGVGSAEDIEEYNGLTGLKLPLLQTVEVRTGEAELLEAVLGVTPLGDPTVEVVPIPVVQSEC